MDKIFQALLIVVLPVTIMAQGNGDKIKSITTVEQATNFIKSNPELKGKLFSISSDKDTTEITLSLFERKIGYTFTFENSIYKIIDTTSHPEFRASYIFLDGNTLSRGQVDTIRKIIIDKYNEGTPFHDLSMLYAMDYNYLGDGGWFRENTMMKPYEDAIRNKKMGEIFEVDIPENKWYYVVLKTHDNRRVKTVKLLKIDK